MISYVLPTRNRQRALSETLDSLGSLPRHDAQVVIVDNASTTPVRAPRLVPNGIAVSVMSQSANIGTAARNVAVRRAVELCGSKCDDHWIVMLDDDSAPLTSSHVELLRGVGRDIAVVAAEVVLPPNEDGTERHESGGLPEVFIGCGAAIRAGVFESLGGYDASFDYYAEEYDFSARVLLAGMRVTYDRRFVVRHRKVESGRDMNRIVGNLVRNNAWIMARYALDNQRAGQVRSQVYRYAAIARKERALRGYLRGLRELAMTLHEQPRRPMTSELWQRFTGYEAAVSHLRGIMSASPMGRTAIVTPGKNVEVVALAAADAGIELTTDASLAETLLIGTMSPGPMLDAAASLGGGSSQRVVTPWSLRGVRPVP